MRYIFVAFLIMMSASELIATRPTVEEKNALAVLMRQEAMRQIQADPLANFNFLSGFSKVPKQIQAAQAADEHRYMLYGGARGPGKSRFVRWYLLRELLRLHSVGINHAMVGLFCEDYPSLIDRQVNKISVEFPAWLGEVKETKLFGFGFYLKEQYGSGVIALRNLDDASKFQSAEFAAEGVDEITKNPVTTFNMLRGSLRWPGVDRPKFIAASNPGGIGHCVPYGDVLTVDGWKPIQDTVIGEKVATLDENEELIYEPIDQLWQEEFNGKLFDFTNATTRIICTPTHKIARRTETKNELGRKFHPISLVEVQKITGTTRVVRSAKGWNGKEIELFSLDRTSNKSRLNQPLSLTGDDFCELMGWYLSEGSVTGKRGQRFQIAQMKQDHREEIESLLDRCGFKYSSSKTEFIIYSPEWYEYLRQFGKCRDKFVPAIIKNTSQRQLNIFVSALFAGDGHGTHYYTTSKRLADDVQEIGLKIGKSPRIASRQRENRQGLSHDINFRIGRDALVERKLVNNTQYNGKVYCIGLKKHHQFFLRQDGNVWLSGNSWVRQYWIDRNFPPELQPLAKEFDFIKALPKDNPFLSQSYWDDLNTQPDRIRRAWVEGDWDAFQGQFFRDFDSGKEVIEPFEIPEGWDLVGSIDPGWSSPCSFGLQAADEEGKIYRVFTYYEEKRNPEQNADGILAMIKNCKETGGRMPSMIYSGGDAFAKKDKYSVTASERTFADVFSARDLILTQANLDRVLGWGSMGMLMPDRYFIFKGYNTPLVEQIISVQSDERNPNDIQGRGNDPNVEDHALDDARYAVQSMDRVVVPKPKARGWVAEMKNRQEGSDKPFRVGEG